MFYLVLEREFEDDLTLFDNDENVLVMCIEQILQFNGTCKFLY